MVAHALLFVWFVFMSEDETVCQGKDSSDKNIEPILKSAPYILSSCIHETGRSTFSANLLTAACFGLRAKSQ